MRELFVTRIVDDDGRSRGGQFLADRFTDTARSAGYQCRFSFERL